MILSVLDKVSDNFIIATAVVANVGEVVFGDGNSSIYLVALSLVTLVIAVYKGRSAIYESRAKKIDLKIKEEELRQLREGAKPPPTPSKDIA